MVTVADIVALPAFTHVELIAPCEGPQQREVRNVGILDCPPDYNEYSAYVPGELILTNLGFAYGNPELAERSLLAMLRRDVAAIAVKTVYDPPISDAVRRESAERGIPVYLYDGAYHETVAYQSFDLIQRDRAELDREKALDELLIVHDDDRIRTRLSAIIGMIGSMFQCFAFTLRRDDACSFYAMLDSVSSLLSAVKEECCAVVFTGAFRYHDRILAFVSYDFEDDEERSAAEKRCLSAVGLEEGLHVGVSETVHLGDGDIAIRQALAAADYSYHHGRHLVRWSELHVAAFAHAVRYDRLFMRTSKLYYTVLSGYDEKHGTELVNTAKALVARHGDVKAVAEELHQHPNTVRYRMRKMKAVLGISSEDDRAFVGLLDLVFLSKRDAI